MEKKIVPDFLKSFHDGSDEEGQIHIERIADLYEAERQTYLQNVRPQRQANLEAGNRKFGEHKELDDDFALRHIKAKYSARAEITAVQHGYVPDGEKQLQEQTEEVIQRQNSVEEPQVKSQPKEDTSQDQSEKQREAAKQAFSANLTAMTQKNITPRHRQ